MRRSSPTRALVIYAIIVLLAATGILAQDGTERTDRPVSTSIREALAADGSIKQGTSGSFDARGFRVVTDERGEPKFIPHHAPDEALSWAVPEGDCNDAWDHRFPVSGAAGTVYAAATDISGNLYIGGAFSAVATSPASRFARWNGTAWDSMGANPNGAVQAIAVSGNNIYIGGQFTEVGGISANFIARWNGSSWSSLGLGMNGTVMAIAVNGSEVYATGLFTTAGGISANRIARWNGSSWSALGSGLNGMGRAILHDGTNLFVGGSFTVVGGLVTDNIARWNGMHWSAMSGGVNSDVRALAVYGGKLYVGGSFSTAGAIAAERLAVWNGSNWESAGSGAQYPVNALAVIGSDLYVGGDFTIFNGQQTGNLVKLSGSTWSVPANSAAPYYVMAIAGHGQRVYVGGGTGSPVFNGISYVENGLWAGWPGGFNGQLASVAVSGSDVYVGGSFTTINGQAFNRIAKWDGTSWSPLGSGMNAWSVDSIAVDGTNVYAAGSFTNAGGTPVNYIARWDGNAWHPLGSGTNSQINAITVGGGYLFATGWFNVAGGANVNFIARWDGSAWSGLGAGLNGAGNSMAFSDSTLYVGGSFSTAGGNPANNIAKWNGTAWTSLGSGVNSSVEALAVSGTNVYAGGWFTAAGGQTAHYIAKWDGTSWSSVGSGMNSAVYSIVVNGSEVFAGGMFTAAGGSSANRIARWNGSSWSALGGGLNATGYRMAHNGRDLFVASGFTTAGCRVSGHFARYIGRQWVGTTSNWHTAGNWSGGTVPTADSSVTISSADASITSADADVLDLRIESGRTLTIGPGRTLTVHGSLMLNGGSIAGTGTVAIVNPQATAIEGGGADGYISARLRRAVGGVGIFRCPVGSSGTYSPVDLSNILGSGQFTVTPNTGAYSGTASGMSTSRLGRWWELTNGGITSASVTFHYAQSDVVGNEAIYRAFRVVDGVAEPRLTSLDVVNNTATVHNATSFSPWTLAELAPTSANVPISGRVMTANGAGITNAAITLTDMNGNMRRATTSSFGYFTFENVTVGESYTITVNSRRFVFLDPSRLITIGDELDNIDFVAEPH